MKKLHGKFGVLVGLGLMVLAVPSCGDDAVGGADCEPGAVRCTGSDVEQCLLTGSGWQVVAQCTADESCVEGLCLADACDPGTRLCAEEAVYECAADGLSWARSVYFFYASVTDSQFPAESREAAFVIPTIPLSQP